MWGSATGDKLNKFPCLSMHALYLPPPSCPRKQKSLQVLLVVIYFLHCLRDHQLLGEMTFKLTMLQLDVRLADGHGRSTLFQSKRKRSGWDRKRRGCCWDWEESWEEGETLI